jgi:hypothetical protein
MNLGLRNGLMLLRKFSASLLYCIEEPPTTVTLSEVQRSRRVSRYEAGVGLHWRFLRALHFVSLSRNDGLRSHYPA